MTPHILIIGENGQVGRELQGVLPKIGRVTATDRQKLDLTKPDDIRRIIREAQPQVIVNAAAYTAVDAAESDEVTAHAVNALAPGVMAEEAKRIGAVMVHYSTDYVFDGSKRTPYVEGDQPNPQNVYGKTKLAGERAVIENAGSHLILRTAWIYAREGRNFMLTILRLARQKEELRIVDDQFGAPTSSIEIATATASILSGLGARMGGFASAGDRSGIYHLTASGETTWYRFAEAILAEVSSRASDEPGIAATGGSSMVIRRLVPISTSEYPTPAKRPAYSVLSNKRLNEVFGLSLPDWRTQLHSVIGQTTSADQKAAVNS